MKQLYYGVKDIVAGEFGELVWAKNDGVASRFFAQVTSNVKVNQNEFELWQLGTFDNETGVFVSEVRQVIIGDYDETE